MPPNGGSYVNRLSISAAIGGIVFAAGIGLVILYHFLGDIVAYVAIGSVVAFALVYLVDYVSELRSKGE